MQTIMLELVAVLCAARHACPLSAHMPACHGVAPVPRRLPPTFFHNNIEGFRTPWTLTLHIYEEDGMPLGQGQYV